MKNKQRTRSVICFFADELVCDFHKTHLIVVTHEHVDLFRNCENTVTFLMVKPESSPESFYWNLASRSVNALRYNHTFYLIGKGV